MKIPERKPKIAIHHEEGSFSHRWIEYCKDNGIDYKLVDCYSTSIISDLTDVDALLFNWWHHNTKARLFMHQLTLSLEMKGILVFPSSRTAWHYDDKVGQKYLLEAIDAPVIKTYSFYEKEAALEWLKKTSYPKVFKLRGGAGSNNVKLVPDISSATSLVNKAFSSGFPYVNKVGILSDRLDELKRNKSLSSFIGVIRALGRQVISTEQDKAMGREIGYVYFQDYIDGNDSDIRVIVVGKRAVAIKRYTRENDFRASGSGIISYDVKEIDPSV
ncbi:ATP-grasp domain-containing protein [Vibrio variabilis]|uniref:ATP-grasp domain-containing protein n=1 Tax=Vibrio variabilis TaxID=990271 RepID=UPI001EFA1F38|nr:hypothetical protein [Vibrio variabilis]